MRWLGQQLSSVPAVHMLEAGTSALWQSLSEQGVSWVARSPGGMRVIQDDCPTNLNAVGKSVGYLPVGQPGDMPGLRAVAGTRPAPLALWASGTEIGLPGRGEAARLRLVCARLIDTVSGQVAGQLFGLTNLSASQADAATVARWLVLQDEARAGFRYMANAWQALPAVDGAHTLARQSLMAGQLGAACWQLAHASAADGVRATLAGVVSPERKLSGRLLPVALLKMFAMLEMAGGVWRRLRGENPARQDKQPANCGLFVLLPRLAGGSAERPSRRRWACDPARCGRHGPGRHRWRRRPNRQSGAARPAIAGCSAGARRSRRRCAC